MVGTIKPHPGNAKSPKRSVVQKHLMQTKLSALAHHSILLVLHVKMAEHGIAVGIDLGTTYSCVGVWQQYRVEIIPNDQGNRTTPSCVAFTDTMRFIGDAARNQAALNPVNTVFGTDITFSI